MVITHSFHLFAKPPELPSWLDAEYLPEVKAIIVYGEIATAGGEERGNICDTGKNGGRNSGTHFCH